METQIVEQENQDKYAEKHHNEYDHQALGTSSPMLLSSWDEGKSMPKDRIF